MIVFSLPSSLSHVHTYTHRRTFAEPNPIPAEVHLKQISCAQMVQRISSGLTVTLEGSMPTSTPGSSSGEQWFETVRRGTPRGRPFTRPRNFS